MDPVFKDSVFKVTEADLPNILKAVEKMEGLSQQQLEGVIGVLVTQILGEDHRFQAALLSTMMAIARQAKGAVMPDADVVGQAIEVVVNGIKRSADNLAKSHFGLKN